MDAGWLLFVFFFESDGDHRDLYSFPTRRSSDLASALALRAGRPLPAPQPARRRPRSDSRSEEHTSALQSRENLVCCLLLENKKCIIYFFLCLFDIIFLLFFCTLFYCL